MKKFLFIITTFLFVTITNAQTVVKSKFVDNTYIGVGTGVGAWLHPNCNGYENFGKSIHSISSLRLGKYITPIFGMELEGEVGMANRQTFVDHTNAGLNLLINMNNVIHGYKENPDFVEAVPFIGLGWRHTYGYVTNNIYSKAGVQVNFNVGKKEAWQINLIPSINYVMTNNGYDNAMPQPRFDSRKSYVNLQVGFTYKFRNSKKTHNFVVCPYSYTQEDVDKLDKKINKQRELMGIYRSELYKNKNVIKSLIKENNELKSRKMNIEYILKNISSAIGFNIGSSEILPTQLANIESAANVIKDYNASIIIRGYADINTGSIERNLELSNARAEAVKEELIRLGVSENNIKIEAIGDTEQLFNENDLNRVVVFEVCK